MQLISSQQDPLPITFDDFWLLYPRRVARKNALKAWSKIHPSHHIELMTSLAAWRSHWIGATDVQFIPHAATWLNGERWTDELPEALSAHASHSPAAIPKLPQRTEMPEHVRAMIARLRK